MHHIGWLSLPLVPKQQQTTLSDFHSVSLVNMRADTFLPLSLQRLYLACKTFIDRVNAKPIQSAALL